MPILQSQWNDEIYNACCCTHWWVRIRTDSGKREYASKDHRFNCQFLRRLRVSALSSYHTRSSPPLQAAHIHRNSWDIWLCFEMTVSSSLTGTPSRVMMVLKNILFTFLEYSSMPVPIYFLRHSIFFFPLTHSCKTNWQYFKFSRCVSSFYCSVSFW